MGENNKKSTYVRPDDNLIGLVKQVLSQHDQIIKINKGLLEVLYKEPKVASGLNNIKIVCPEPGFAGGEYESD